MAKSNVQSIDCRVELKENKSYFYLTGVYAYNERVDKIDLWRDLITCASYVGDQPWIILGDFNVVRWQSEKLDGNIVDRIEMDEFNKCIDDIQGQDMCDAPNPVRKFKPPNSIKHGAVR